MMDFFANLQKGVTKGAIDQVIKTLGTVLTRERIYKLALEDIARGEDSAGECYRRAERALREAQKAG